MGPSNRRSSPSLERVLLSEGGRFDFFQAVRILERLHPERRPVGRDAGDGLEAVRFLANASLVFPASDIDELVSSKEGCAIEMVVNFLGLFGPAGALPRHYTEMVIARNRADDHALQAFLDLFNHRIVSLFYRAWERYRFPIAFERSVAALGTDAPRRAKDVDAAALDSFARHLLDLVGLGTDHLLEGLDLDLRSMLFHAGLLARVCRSASALEGLLRGYFGVDVEVLQFTGQWLAIPPELITHLGAENSRLGESAVAGRRFWDPQTKFTIRLGPIARRKFEDFLPCSDAFLPLVQLAHYFAGEELDFDVQLVVLAAEVPQCHLGGEIKHGSRLGWSSWMKSTPFTSDADDAVFDGRRALGQLGAWGVQLWLACEAWARRDCARTTPTSGGQAPDEEGNHEHRPEFADRTP